MNFMSDTSLYLFGCTCRMNREAADQCWQRRALMDSVFVDHCAPFASWRDLYLAFHYRIRLESSRVVLLSPPAVLDASEIHLSEDCHETTWQRFPSFTSAVEMRTTERNWITAARLANTDCEACADSSSGAWLYRQLAEHWPWFWPLGRRFVVKETIYAEILDKQDDQDWIMLVDVLELVAEGQNSLALTMGVLRCLIAQTLFAISVADAAGLFYADLRSDNLAINVETGQVVLMPCQLMSAQDRYLNFKHKRHSNPIAPNPFWMAPEIIRHEEYPDGRAMVWMLGCLVYECLYMNPPYFEFPPLRALFLIITKGVSVPTPGVDILARLRPEEADQAFDFCRKCLVKEREERPFPSSLMDDPFVKGQLNERATLVKWAKMAQPEVQRKIDALIGPL